jgi:hypothetical protein
MKYQEMTIGGFYRFDYHSQTPPREYVNPVRINLTDARRMEIIASVQAQAKEGEARFKALLAEVDKPGGLTDMQLRLQKLDEEREAERIARGLKKKPNKSQAYKDLEEAMKKEWHRLIGSKRDGSTMATGEKFFYRAYKAPRIEQKPDGKIYGCLVSKSILQNGEISFTFLRLSPVTVEKAEYESLPKAEQEKIILV